jgi:hypothetical protein
MNISNKESSDTMCKRNLFSEKENNEVIYSQPNHSLLDPLINSQNSNLTDILNNSDDKITTPAFKRQKLDIDNVKKNSPSIYQRWLKRDHAFIGKFSNGTTPK